MKKILSFLSFLSISITPSLSVTSCIPIISDNPNISDLYSFDLDFSNPEKYGGWEKIKQNYEQEITKQEQQLKDLEQQLKDDKETSKELKDFLNQTTVYMTEMQISVWKCIVSEAKFNLNNKTKGYKTKLEKQLQETINFINNWKFMKPEDLSEEEKLMSKPDVEIWTRIQLTLKTKLEYFKSLDKN